MSLYGEFKRRNVIRVAIFYMVGAWLLFEIASMAFPALGIPEVGIRILLILLTLGFLPALIAAWSYVITSEGVMRDAPVTRSSAKRLDIFVIALVIAALSLFTAGHFWFKAGPTGQQVTPVGSVSEPVQALGSYPANSIAVLPFVNMSDDAANEYFSDGISEELLNLLAGVQELRVISRSSAFSYKNKGLDIPTIAEELNVAHILEGSVRKADDRVRITVQLIDARSDTRLWFDTYDRTLDDIFAIQDEIAQTVVEQLKVTLLGEAPSSNEIDAEAYTLYLQARYLGRQYSAENLERSNELYQRALAIDASIAPAWSGLATNYINQVANGLLSFEEGFTRAREAAERALVIDPGYAPAHTNLGWIALGYNNDVARAARHYGKALNLDPGNTYLIRSAAVLMRSLNRPEEAIHLGEYVTEHDPLVASGHHNLGIAYFRAGRWGEAIASQQTALRLSPGFLGANYAIGVALLFKGDAASALEVFSREKDEEYRIKGTALSLHELDRRDESQDRIAELIERWGNEWPSEVAHAYAYIGEADAAFQWLDKAVEQGEEGLREQPGLPFYRNLHSDPRWPTFLERINSSPAQLEAIEFNVLLPD